MPVINYASALARALDDLKFYADPTTYFGVALRIDKPAGAFADDVSYAGPEFGRCLGARARAGVAAVEEEIRAQQAEMLDRYKELAVSEMIAERESSQGPAVGAELAKTAVRDYLTRRGNEYVHSRSATDIATDLEAEIEGGKDRRQQPLPQEEKNQDKVNHPSHYQMGKIEVAVAMDVLGEPSQWLGHALKYACRAPHKGKLHEDLRKAIWCARHAVELGCTAWYGGQGLSAMAALANALNDGLKDHPPVREFVSALVHFGATAPADLMRAANVLEGAITAAEVTPK